jgi:probable HAF family extracellular repeat protein
MKHRSLGPGCASPEWHLNNLSVLALFAFMALGAASPAFAQAMFMGLGDLPGGFFQSEALAVSSDGSVVVGVSRSASGPEAFRWENGAMIGLGGLPGGEFFSRAFAASADGSVIVGSGSRAGEDSGETFIWDAATGMRSLQDVLVEDFGLDLGGWRLNDAGGAFPRGALPGFVWVLKIFFPAEGMVIARTKGISNSPGRGAALSRLSRCKIELSMRGCWESKIRGV